MNARLIVCGVLISLALAGCSKYQEKVFKDQAIAWLKDQMNDPNSAQFEGLEVLWRDDEQIILCGKMNAKNRMGGYVGFTPFFVVGDLEDGKPTNLRGAAAPTSFIDRDDQHVLKTFLKSYENNCGPLK